MDRFRRVAWTVGRAGAVLAVVATVLSGCHADGSAERPAGAGSSAPLTRPSDRLSDQPASSSSPSAVRPHRAAMPEVAMRSMYARGASSEGVLVSTAGTTETGRSASAYVPTRTGAVFASGHRVYDLVEGGTAVAIGSLAEQSVFLQVDPTLRYVVWELRRPDGIHSRAFVYDVVARRTVLDRVLLWGDRTSPLRVVAFGAARLRLVHLPGSDFWTFATSSGRALVTPGGQVVDLHSHQVQGPVVSRGLWSPGLRYRASGASGRHPWQVVDLVSGRDVTPAALPGTARLTGWLGNTTFGVLMSSGTWRHSSVAASVCRVAGRCHVVWRLQLGADDGGLQQSNEIG